MPPFDAHRSDVGITVYSIAPLSVDPCAPRKRGALARKAAQRNVARVLAASRDPTRFATVQSLRLSVVVVDRGKTSLHPMVLIISRGTYK